MNPITLLHALGRSALMLAACMLAYDGASGGDAPEPTVRDVLPRDPSAVEQRAAAIRAALVSVEYHALRDPPNLPPEVMPIPLATAVRTLRQDADDNSFGESRRRRSITALVVGGVDPSVSPPRIRNREEIDVLLGPQQSAFDAFLTALLPRVFVGPSPLVLDSDPSLRRLSREIQAFLDTAGPAIASCAAQDAERLTPHTPTSSCGTTFPAGLIWERARIEVTRPGGVAGLASALDPQNWDETDVATGLKCNPFFTSAFVTDASKSPVSCPPLAGQDWAHPLYEEFHMSVGASDGQLATVLKIKANLDPDSPTVATGHHFDYCLGESVFGQVITEAFNVEKVWEGSIDVDEGFQTIEKPGALVVVADKKLHFTGWTEQGSGADVTAAMNAAATLNLMAMGQALKEAVCCNPPPTPACPPGAPVLIQ